MFIDKTQFLLIQFTKEMKGTIVSNLSKDVAILRKKRGLTQAQMAELIEVSRPTYANIEAGDKDLTIPQAERIAAALRIDLDELLSSNSQGRVAINPENALSKYKQMILNSLQYGADKDGKITKTKLAKLVYLADFTWFYEKIVPMSGMSYRKLPRGPVPDIYFRALDELIEDGVIELETKDKAFLFSMVEKGEAPSTRLSGSEKAAIKKIGKAWRGKQTSEIVDFTHKQLPWQICREGEIIPYNLITQEEPDAVYGPVKPKL